MSIVVVGDRYLVTAFRLAGVRGIVAESFEEVKESVSRLVEEGEVKVIILSEANAVKLRKLRSELVRSKQVYPIFAVIPGFEGSMNERLNEIYTLISQAVGVRLKLEG